MSHNDFSILLLFFLFLSFPLNFYFFLLFYFLIVSYFYLSSSSSFYLGGVCFLFFIPSFLLFVADSFVPFPIHFFDFILFYLSKGRGRKSVRVYRQYRYSLSRFAGLKARINDSPTMFLSSNFNVNGPGSLDVNAITTQRQIV